MANQEQFPPQQEMDENLIPFTPEHKFWYSAKALNNSKVSFSIPTGGIYEVLGLNTFRKAIGAHYMSYSSNYENPPSIDISASRYDASINSIAEADPGTSASNDYLPLQQGKDEGIKNHSLDHIFAGTNSNVLANKTKSISDGLETVLTTPKTGTSNVAKLSEEIKFGEIKLKDMAKLVPNVKADFKDLDSPKDDLIIVVDESEGVEDEDKNEEIHSTINDETEDNSASTPLSPREKPPAFTPVVAGVHKEDQQATGCPTSLGVTSEEGANPQLNSTKSKVGADSGLSTPKDSISQTIGNDEKPNKLSLDHIFAGTNPCVLVEKTISASKGLETVLTQPT
ncbi:hypothetical protein Tco_1435937, partial [Tanacetum coccineum]